jgi:hypothetical protein
MNPLPKDGVPLGWALTKLPSEVEHHLSPAQILSGAKTLLENGWCTGDWSRTHLLEEGGRGQLKVAYCSMGAIHQVAHGSPIPQGYGENSINSASEQAALDILAKQVQPDFADRFKEKFKTELKTNDLTNPQKIVTHWNDLHEIGELPNILHHFDIAAKIASGE